MLTELLALSSLIMGTRASRCDVDPTRILIQDTQVLEDVEGSYMIGMRATFGSPAQSLLMLPWPCVLSSPLRSRVLLAYRMYRTEPALTPVYGQRTQQYLGIRLQTLLRRLHYME